MLDDLSFEVAPGDVIGVLGKNGAGKTTLLELMLGFTPPSGGGVRLFGHPLVECLDETRFANPRLACQQDRLALTRLHLLPPLE